MCLCLDDLGASELAADTKERMANYQALANESPLTARRVSLGNTAAPSPLNVRAVEASSKLRASSKNKVSAVTSRVQEPRRSQRHRRRMLSRLAQ